MTIQSYWYNPEKSIIRSEVTEPWTWEDAEVNRRRLLEMAQSVAQPLGLIVMLPLILSLPPRGFAQQSRQTMQNHQEAGFYRIVYVCPNPALRPLWEQSISAFALDALRYHVVSKLAEALALFASDA